MAARWRINTIKHLKNQLNYTFQRLLIFPLKLPSQPKFCYQNLIPHSNMKLIFFAALTVMFFAMLTTQTACYYDNEQEQYGVNQCDTTAVSYSTNIKPIIEQNCISCHAPGGAQETAPLVTYDQLKNYATSGALVDRTNGTSSLMPPSGKMSNCNLLFIKAWVDAGAPNN